LAKYGRKEVTEKGGQHKTTLYASKVINKPQKNKRGSLGVGFGNPGPNVERLNGDSTGEEKQRRGKRGAVGNNRSFGGNRVGT